jgi:hypothetical protein
MDEYAFVATYSSTKIKGHTFESVGDALVERGFVMAEAVQVAPMTLEVPHSNPRRAKARLVANLPEPVRPEPIAMQPDLERALAKAAESFMNDTGAGLNTRPCGAVHSDGVACLIPVLYEALTCGCGDYVYDHDGPHESEDENGVKYRWTEVLLIQDAEFNAYGPMDDADDTDGLVNV